MAIWDLPNSGIEPRSPALQADSLPAKLLGKPGKQCMFRLFFSQFSGIMWNEHPSVYILKGKKN